MKTILVSAYACEPLKGSEQGVGWNWVLQLAKTNYLHVITRANNQNPIEKHLPQDLKDNITFHFYDTIPIIKGLKNKAKGLYLYYFFWQLGIIPLVKKIISKQDIDYTMHLTMGSVWMPTFLSFFKTPFIWGPIGGGDNEPKTFSEILPVKQRILHYFRRVLNSTLKFNPFVRYTSYKSIAILCRTVNTAKLFPKSNQSKIKVVLETAMESEIFNFNLKNNIQEEFNLITTGRLMPSKNIISLVRALNILKVESKILLTIIGSGSEKQRILKEASSLSDNIKIKLIKEIPRNEVLNTLQGSDVYVFPSLREGGSWALMEAMAIGLPVICIKWSGMEIITDENSAIQLPVSNPKQMPKDIEEAICKLIDNPSERQRMGNAARERIKTIFNWEAKGAFMEQLFIELENKKSNRK